MIESYKGFKSDQVKALQPSMTGVAKALGGVEENPADPLAPTSYLTGEHLAPYFYEPPVDLEEEVPSPDDLDNPNVEVDQPIYRPQEAPSESSQEAPGEMKQSKTEQSPTVTAQEIIISQGEFSVGNELTDLGNADRFVQLYGHHVRYSVKHGEWLIWDGKRWALDERGVIYELAGKTVRSILVEASNAIEKEESIRLSKWGIRSQDRTQIEHLLALAKHKVAVLIDELDYDPRFLNCQNGTINLRTGELRPHDPSDLITKIVNADFNNNAECPTWMAFLDRIMGGNIETIHFLRRAVGYSITGLTVEQCLFILHGNGANGKSTFLETLARLLGNGYATGTPTESILQKRFDSGIPNDLARLKGARLVCINEVELGRRMAESKVKAMTGGDTITARFMRAEFFEFIPEFKLWLRTNHKPVIIGTDNAIWRRIRLIPFEVEIPENEQDPYLMEKLAQEYEGILSWAVAGCLDWWQERLKPPEKVVKATNIYRDEMDTIGHFLNEKTEAGESVSSKALYLTYIAWCDENGDRPISQRVFSQALSEKGFENKHTKRGNVFIGLSIVKSLKDGEG